MATKLESKTAVQDDNISQKFWLAKQNIENFVKEIKNRAGQPMSIPDEATWENNYLALLIHEAIVVNPKNPEADLIPYIKDEDWKKLFGFLNDLYFETGNKKAVHIMRETIERCMRILCGKVRSKRLVHDILIKATKLHSLSFNGKKVFNLVHPHFCTSLYDLEEVQLFTADSDVSEVLAVSHKNLVSN